VNNITKINPFIKLLSDKCYRYYIILENC